ncbi:MAG: NAD(P)/FAD-dependent oxidoreductase [Arenimonas sp.]
MTNVNTASYYSATANFSIARPSLTAKKNAKICIIGGGFAGINTALGLAERGVKNVVLCEAKHLAFGASGRNGGFVFAGFSRGPESLLKDLGQQAAKQLYKGTVDAVNLIRQRINHYKIDCQHTDAGVYWANWFRDQAILKDFQKLLSDSFDTHWDFIPQSELKKLIRTDRYKDALYEKNSLHFHPLNYALGIAEAAEKMGVEIYENTPAIQLLKSGSAWLIKTPEAEIEAEQVVLACGGYLANLYPKIDASVLPIATYVMVTEPLGDRMQNILQTKAAIYDTRFAFDYYRPLPDSRLLWGGRISVLDRSPDAVKKLLQQDLIKVFPQLSDVTVDYAWSGLMSYARHEMPQIAEIEKGLWCGQAFGGHGVAPTTFAGELLAAAIAEDDLRWKNMASYGLVSALKPAGFVGAQLTYWWLQAKDGWKDRMEAK